MSERNSDESYERLRSTHQTRRKRSVLETYDHERRKMDLFTTMSAEKEIGVGEAPERQAKAEIHQKKV